jgi:hypothetical protein
MRWREAAIAHIRALDPALVIMSGADNDIALLVGAQQDKAWADGWATTFAGLGSPGPRQVLMLDTAWPSTDVPACISRRPPT